MSIYKFLSNKYGSLRSNVIYPIKAFLQNLPHFLKSSWKFRWYDHNFIMQTWHDDLIYTAHYYLSDKAMCMNRKVIGRRMLTAAGYIRKAYLEDHFGTDKSLAQLYKNNPIILLNTSESDFLGRSYKVGHKYKHSEKTYRKLLGIIQKRLDQEYIAREKQVWAYLGKHMKSFWD